MPHMQPANTRIQPRALPDAHANIGVGKRKHLHTHSAYSVVNTWDLRECLLQNFSTKQREEKVVSVGTHTHTRTHSVPLI